MDSDGHRQQIFIVPAALDRLTEKFLQTNRGGDTVGPASGYIKA